MVFFSPLEIYPRLFLVFGTAVALTTLLKTDFYKICLFHWGTVKEEDNGEETKGKNIGRKQEDALSFIQKYLVNNSLS